MLFLSLLITILAVCSQGEANVIPVTHEDIRYVMLRMVRVMAAMENKLSRHEMRERILGDNVRKMLVGLDQRLSKLDQKMGMILDSDDKGEIRDREMKESLAEIPTTIKEIKENIIHQIRVNGKIGIGKSTGGSSTEANLTKPAETLGEPEDTSEEKEDDSTEKIQTLTSQIEQLRKDLSTMRKVQDQTSKSIEQIEKHLNDNQKLSVKILDKLENEKDNYDVPAQDAADAWQISIIEALERQEDYVEKTLAQVKNMRGDTLDFIKNLETSINASADHSKIFLEDAIEKLINRQGAATRDLSGLSANLEILNLAMEDVQEKLTNISNKVCNEDFEKAKLSLAKCHQDATNSQGDAQRLTDSEQPSSGTDDLTTLQRKILSSVENLDTSISQNADSTKELLERVESILANGEQMLQFSRKSSQDITDAIETLMINMEVHCGNS